MKFSLNKFDIEVLNLLPNPDTPGDWGGGGGGGGEGRPPTGGGGPVPANLSALTSSGGLFGFDGVIALPINDNFLNHSCLGFFDWDNFDTEEDCFYKYRVEELQPGRYVTIKMVQIIYRNLGPAIINVRIEGPNEDNVYHHIEKDFLIGTSNPDNKLYELDASLEITVKRPQLILSRKANKGPISITRTTMIGKLGEGNIL